MALAVGTPHGVVSRVYSHLKGGITRHRALWSSDFPPPAQGRERSPASPKSPRQCRSRRRGMQEACGEVNFMTRGVLGVVSGPEFLALSPGEAEIEEGFFADMFFREGKDEAFFFFEVINGQPQCFG